MKRKDRRFKIIDKETAFTQYRNAAVLQEQRLDLTCRFRMFCDAGVCFLGAYPLVGFNHHNPYFFEIQLNRR